MYKDPKLIYKTPKKKVEEILSRLGDHCARTSVEKINSEYINNGFNKNEDHKNDDNSATNDACNLPEFILGPENIVTFHQRIELEDLYRLENLSLSCVSVSPLDIKFGLIQRYTQAWDFQKTQLGSPVSHISLSPLEQRQIEIAHKRKSSMSRSDRAKRSFRLSLDSASSTKASSNTTSTSVSRLNWSVSASGSYGIGSLGVTASGNLSGAINRTRQRAVNLVTDETEKSSRQVQTETETTTKVGLQTSFEHIEEYSLRNPYADRTMLVTLYELIDTYHITTSTSDLIPCLIFEFDPISKDEQRKKPAITFDEAFVNTHSQFIRTALLDDNLAEYLDANRQLGKLEENRADIGDVAENANRCLEFMFKDTGIFAAKSDSDYNIDDSFNVTLSDSGFKDSRTTKLTDLYLLMASVRFLWNRDKAEFESGDLTIIEFERRAIEYVQMLYDGLRGWEGVKPSTKEDIHNTNQKTEQFRRVPAFLSMAKELVLNLIGLQERGDGLAIDDEESNENEENSSSTTPQSSVSNPRVSAAARLTNHLNCFGRYYTEEYLHFLHQWTGVSSIEELIASAPSGLREFLPFLSFEDSFIDRTAWIIPLVDLVKSHHATSCFLDDETLGEFEPIKQFSEVRQPADGVHMEAVPGSCRLPDLPVDSTSWNPPMRVSVSSDDDTDSGFGFTDSNI